MNSPRVITKRVLEIVQILYQNKAINENEKQSIIRELQNSYKTNSLQELHKIFVDLNNKVVLFKELVEEVLNLTN